MRNDKAELEKLKEYTLKIIGQRVDLRQEGDNWVGICPFHSERSGSFKVTKKDGSWFYKCFGCNEAGDVITFLEKFESVNTARAIEMLKEYAGVKDWHKNAAEVGRVFQNVGDAFESTEGKKKQKFTMAQWAKAEAALAVCPEAKQWLELERGIPMDVAKSARLGYCQTCPGHVDNEAVRNSGWVMFPRIYADEVVTVKMRSIKAKSFSQVKDMRQDTLFGAELISTFEPVFVTEGEMDALSLQAAGFIAVSIPAAGYKLTPDMKNKIMSADTVYLAGDNDGGVGTEYMQRLWKELKDRTYLIKWPDVKDANDYFRKVCKGNKNEMYTRVSKLMATARENPVDGIYSIISAMESADGTNLMDNPHRLHFRQPSIDRMAINPPGSVVVVYSSYSGTGKSTFVADPMIHEARRGEVVLVYSAELSVDENIRIIASHVLGENRDTISAEKFKECANTLKGKTAAGTEFRYYIGYNPDLHGHDAVLDFIEHAIRTLGVTRVVIDHIHHIISANDGNLAETESKAMKRIKDMATQYGIIFIVVAQSNKEGQSVKNIKNDEHGVVMGSVAFQMVPHTVYLIHRKVLPVEDPNNPPDDRLSEDTDIICKKIRTKGPGKPFVRLVFNGKVSTFFEKSFQEQLEPVEDDFVLD